MNPQIMTASGFPNAYEEQQAGICPICKSSISLDSFKDVLSIQDYAITGLCQKCQDRIYANPED